jgi:membrane protein YdbS with pleckstrin-like domain
MFTPVRTAVLKLFKVPPEPELPAGSPGSVRTFRAAPNFFKLKLLLWGVRQAAAFAGLVVFIAVWQVASSGVPRELDITVNVVKAFSILLFLAQLPVTYAIVRLDWEMRWYIATDRSLRIRAGIWHVQEMTMTFANIQQISVHQGPLQRLLGIYDLEVSTAGGGAPVHPTHGGKTNTGHRGFFHGIDNAPEIRDMMLERLRRLRDTGLGDPDEPETVVAPVAHDFEALVLAAARELLREARALRQAAV